MRRRSELKKSTEASPAPSPVSRRTSRRSRRSPEVEKTNQDIVSQKQNDETQEVNDDATSNNAHGRSSSEERLQQQTSRKRSSRRRTPLSDRIETPTKKRNQRDAKSPVVATQETIPEENENGEKIVEKVVEATSKSDGGVGGDTVVTVEEEKKELQQLKSDSNDENVAATLQAKRQSSPLPPPCTDDDKGTVGVDQSSEPTTPPPKETSLHREVTVVPSPSFSSKAIKDDELKTTDVLDIRTEDVERDSADAFEEKDEQLGKTATNEQSPKKRNARARKTSSQEREKPIIRKESPKNNTKVHSNGDNIDEEHAEGLSLAKSEEQKENIEHTKPNSESVNKQQLQDENKESASVDVANEPIISNDATCHRAIRKRRWITKKVAERNAPVLAISTDSLKNIIADVQPVPLSDVQLDTSSEEEGVISDRDDGERSMTPERVIILEKPEKTEKPLKRKESLGEISDRIDKSATLHDKSVGVNANTVAAAISTTLAPAGARSPSPARNRASSVLYITNLVRPFTVLQLKGLLARTGKIVEDGFWIDRIKSKCYVEYETEDEATETRHALHGVRWPVSNPKCLNVDFGSKSSMERAVQSSKDEAPKLGQENSRDNQNASGGWTRNEVDDKRNLRPVREWDVGKKESLDQEKNKSDKNRRSKERDGSRVREHDRSDRDRDRKQRVRSRDRGEQRSRSISPARKVAKKENEPPIRLLDDLFRKTKSTPCIYWLPLTPEQIAEKEAFRQKRIEEHKQRVKERELEREKERERDRERNKERERERDRDRDRDSRRHRSNDRDRRRSRSRDRRRY